MRTRRALLPRRRVGDREERPDGVAEDAPKYADDGGRALFRDFHALLTDVPPEGRDFGKLEVLAGVREFPARVKCATLAWHTLHNALEGGGTAKTE